MEKLELELSKNDDFCSSDFFSSGEGEEEDDMIYRWLMILKDVVFSTKKRGGHIQEDDVFPAIGPRPSIDVQCKLYVIHEERRGTAWQHVESLNASGLGSLNPTQDAGSSPTQDDTNSFKASLEIPTKTRLHLQLESWVGRVDPTYG